MDLYKLTLTLLTASSYLFAIYFAEPANIKNKHRDDLDVVYYRIKRIIILCILSIIIIPNLIDKRGYFENIKELGIIPGYSKSNDIQLDLINILKTLYFILILYSSTLLQLFIGEFEIFDDYEEEEDENSKIYKFRNYILAPISEELIYRGLIMLIIDKDQDLIKISPYLFGIAHLHHGYQLYFIKKESLLKVLLSIGFQFIYTSIFGMLVLFFYNKTLNNLWCCIVLHAVCNLFGIPSFNVRSNSKIVKILYYGLIIFGIVHSYIYIQKM